MAAAYLATAVTLIAAFSLGARSAAAAGPPSSYSIVAAANAGSVEVDAANFPLLAPQAAYLSVSTAQAELDSFGGSTAFAGAPFAGQTIEGVGGLVSGLGSGGVLPPLPPTLPGYVTTSNPAKQSDSATQGPYTLDAHSDTNTSTSTAGIAAVAGQPKLLSAAATASATLNTDDSLIATADSTTQPLAIGGLVQLGTISATATMTVDPDGKLRKSSSLDLGTITVAGIKVGLGEDGLQVVGGVLPGPSMAAINGLLRPAGLSIEFLPETETRTSVTSAGLQITEKRNLPIEGASGVVITIGQATASLTYHEAPPSSSTTPAGQGPPSFPRAGSSPSFPAQDTLPGSAGGVLAPEIAGAPSPTQITAVSPMSTESMVRLGPDATRWYLLLIAAGIMLTAASRLASHFALGAIQDKTLTPRSRRSGQDRSVD
jgi:hypothetical protein